MHKELPKVTCCHITSQCEGVTQSRLSCSKPTPSTSSGSPPHPFTFLLLFMPDQTPISSSLPGPIPRAQGQDRDTLTEICSPAVCALAEPSHCQPIRVCRAHLLGNNQAGVSGGCNELGSWLCFLPSCWNSLVKGE